MQQDLIEYNVTEEGELDALTSVDKSECDTPPMDENEISQSASIKKRPIHFEIKTSGFGLQTNISRVDESFVDYLAETKQDYTEMLMNKQE